VCFTIGSVDPLYLFGDGADGVEVPKKGFGLALGNAEGGHYWVGNEVKGLTDEGGLLPLGKDGRGGKFVDNGPESE
jgi:hypothetical protein